MRNDEYDYHEYEAESFDKFTYDELKKEVNDERESMSKDEKYMRLVNCDPTFKEYVLGAIKEGQTVEINEYTKEYRIL